MGDNVQDLVIGSVIGVVFLSLLGLYFYVLVDIQRRKVKYMTTQTLWLNMVWMMPVLGPILYLINRRHIWKTK